MNETPCNRCYEEPATLLIDHCGYGEPVCKACREDEDRHEIAKMFGEAEGAADDLGPWPHGD